MANLIFEKVYEFEVEKPAYLSTLILVLLQSRTPVDTGKLRNSWVVTVDVDDFKETKLTILNTAEYSYFVEYGTRKMSPREMLTGAIEYIEELLKSSSRLEAPKTRIRNPRSLSKKLERAVNIAYQDLPSKNVSKINMRSQAYPIKTPSGFPKGQLLPSNTKLTRFTNKLLKNRGAI